ncbi:MAG: sigma-70 family RNA polymerase sigma factor [Phycisphaerae bacterium]|nr:sigma-70 family RNA polymerase sigma factor [Phycisphaerae bacterium]
MKNATITEQKTSYNLSASEQNTFSKLMAKPMDYMDNDSFVNTTEMAQILSTEVVVLPGQTIPPKSETILFLQMNYYRYQIRGIQDSLAYQPELSQAQVEQMLKYNTEQLNVRSKIVSGNMGLVLSMAQKVDYPGVDFTDLVSEGSMALLRATEKFDASMGFRFSTYACRAILKGFSRAAKQSYRYNKLFPTQCDALLEGNNDQIDFNQKRDQSELADEVNTIMNNNLADLSDIEETVVRMRFAIGQGPKEPMTLKSVGESLHLTKERIRQIQNKALVKLKNLTESRLCS